MIDTLFFLLQIAGFLVLIGWAVVHDRLAGGASTGGPLAFKPSETDDTGRSRARRSRTESAPPAGLTRRRGKANLEDWRR